MSPLEHDTLTRTEYHNARDTTTTTGGPPPPRRPARATKDGARTITAGRNHGRIATYNVGCRCPDCTEAARVTRASHRAAARTHR